MNIRGSLASVFVFLSSFYILHSTFCIGAFSEAV
jgi:hypothetical protein